MQQFLPKLYVVPTPIGNLEDITLRALRVLRDADLVLAEDTRTAGILLRHYEIIAKKMQSHHRYNEHGTVAVIVERIAGGEKVAIVTDAGTPGISDPGFLLIRECITRGIPVECLPGPVAFIPALVASGLPCDKFCFEGFLPQKKGRQTRLSELAQEKRTIIFYESPFRVMKLLEQLSHHFGPGRRVSVSRELTKIHEETQRGTIAEIIAHYNEHTLKGEVVIVVEGKKEE